MLVLFLPLWGMAQITTYPYTEDFESGPGGWTSGGVNSSWALVTPNMSVINAAASGDSAWASNLGAGVSNVPGTGYNDSENSFVESPFFDFSSLAAPVFSANIWWDIETGFDGVVLQSSLDSGRTWQNVGAFGDPFWYNDDDIDGLPGGQLEGWTGSPGSLGYFRASRSVANLGGQSRVQFRFALGSDGSVRDNGFAFDDVRVEEGPPAEVGIIGLTNPSGCGLGATDTIKLSYRNNGSAAVDSVRLFYSINGATPTVAGLDIRTVQPGDTAVFTFTTPASFPGPLFTSYQFLGYLVLNGDTIPLNDTLRTTIVSRPSINTFPYFEGFEFSQGGWTPGIINGTANSWVRGTPGGFVINSAASGTQSWHTSVTTGGYSDDEESFVVSPCFDFSSLVQPVFRASVWWESEEDFDGTVVQYSLDGGSSWVNIGAFGDPNNWFNNDNITGDPGGQPEGWSGTVGSGGSGAWVTAERALTGLGGEPNVLIRFAFGSDGSVTEEGFAFDNVEIFDSPPTEAAMVNLLRPQTGCGLTNKDSVEVSYANTGSNSFDSTMLFYQIGTGSPVMALDTANIKPGDTVSYTFATTANLATPGTYDFTIWLVQAGDPNQLNDTLRFTIVNVPEVTTFPYLEDFEAGAGGWREGGTSSSWELGTPVNKRRITGAASGTQAWVTGEDTVYNIGENSFVIGPCFDFTSLTRPIFRANIWWESEWNFDGAALQTSIDGGQTWQTVGAIGDPNNWYTNDRITGSPGGQPEGWSGADSLPFGPPAPGQGGSGGYVLAERDLTGLGGQSEVLIRFVFGSDGSVQYDGFAFDDVEILEAPAASAGMVTFERPLTGCSLSGTDTVEITYVNKGSAAFDSARLAYSINGGTAVVEIDTSTVNVGDTATYVFTTTANLGTPGTYTFDVWVDLAGDPFANDDSLRGITIIHKTPISNFPYVQNFDGPAWPVNNGFGSINTGEAVIALPDEWENVQGEALNPQQDWAVRSAASPTGTTGPPSDHTTGLANYLYVEDSGFDNDSVMVVTPCFDLTGLTNPELRFWLHSNNANAGAPNPQESIIHLDILQNGVWTRDITTPIGNASPNWVQASIPIGIYTTSGVVAFRFRVDNNNGGFGHDIAIDDFEITEVLPRDAGAIAIDSPVSGCGLTASEDISIRVTNFGTTTLDTILVGYRVNNNPVVTDTLFGPLLSGDTTTFTFATPADLSTPNTAYALSVFTRNLSGDTNIGNDSTSGIVLHKDVITMFPYLETFDDTSDFPVENVVFSPGVPGTNGTQLDGDWENSQEDTRNSLDPQDWVARQAPTGSGGTGPNGDHTTGSGTYLYVEDSGFDNDSVILISPCFDISSLINPELRFWYFSFNSGTPVDSNRLHVDAIFQGQVIRDIIPPISERSSSWEQDTADLSAFSTGVVAIRFRVDNNNFDFSHDIAIDDVEIVDVPPNDMGSLGLAGLNDNDCGSGAQPLEVIIQNFGRNTQRNFPVGVTILGPGVNQTLTTTYTDSIVSGQTDTVLAGIVNTSLGGSYQISTFTVLPGDQNTSNDTLFFTTQLITLPPSPIGIGDSACAASDSLLLYTLTQADYHFWYDTLIGGSILASNDTFFTPLVTRNTNFYVTTATAKQDTLDTQYDGQDFGAGNFFDVTANFDITVDSFAMNIDDLGVTTEEVKVYFKPGSYQGFQTNPGAWTLVDSVVVTPNGQGALTRIPIGGLNIQAGQTVGMAIEVEGSFNAVFTNLPAGTQSSNRELTITSGEGFGPPIFGTPIPDRAWNGTIYYTGPGCESPRIAVPATISTPPTVNLGPDGVFCGSRQLDGTTPGAVSYLWSTGDTTASILATTTSQYVVEVFNAQGCVGSDTVNLLIQPNPSVNLGPDTTNCGDYTLDAGNPGSSYAWSNGQFNQSITVSTSGTYSVTVTNTAGCISSDTVNVSIQIPPIVNLGPDVTRCGSVTLDAGNPGLTYAWSTTETTQQIVVTSSGTYSVDVTDANGCVGTDDVVIGILPEPAVDLGPDTVVCDSALLDPGSNPGSSYVWSNGVNSPTIFANTTGQYFVTVTNTSGCSKSDTVNLTIAPTPQASFTFTPQGTGQVNFTNLSSAGPGTTYAWDFGDGGTSNMQDPSYTYGATGTYIVKLVVTNACGSDSVLDEVSVVTSLADEAFGRLIELYPNPTRDKFVVEITDLEGRAISLQLTDMRGREVFVYNEPAGANELRQEIDLGDQAEGVYLLRVSDGERTVYRKVV
ncbi:MAG: PKD domain-containing protein, partial [Bacteroidota bacterium]